jgi:hypothetical protein
MPTIVSMTAARQLQPRQSWLQKAMVEDSHQQHSMRKRQRVTPGVNMMRCTPLLGMLLTLGT